MYTLEIELVDNTLFMIDKKLCDFEYNELEGQWPWIPRELQQFVDAGWSVFTKINFGNNVLFCK